MNIVTEREKVRDQIALEVMKIIIKQEGVESVPISAVEYIAKASYLLADAMMKERDREEKK